MSLWPVKVCRCVLVLTSHTCTTLSWPPLACSVMATALQLKLYFVSTCDYKKSQHQIYFSSDLLETCRLSWQQELGCDLCDQLLPPPPSCGRRISPPSPHPPPPLQGVGEVQWRQINVVKFRNSTIFHSLLTFDDTAVFGSRIDILVIWCDHYTSYWQSMTFQPPNVTRIRCCVLSMDKKTENTHTYTCTTVLCKLLTLTTLTHRISHLSL